MNKSDFSQRMFSKLISHHINKTLSRIIFQARNLSTVLDCWSHMDNLYMIIQNVQSNWLISLILM